MTDTSQYIPPTAGTTADKRNPDPQGQAALMLVESLLHELIANKTLSLDQGINLVVVAAEVKEAIADEAHERRAILNQSLGILEQIAASLRTDAP